MVVLTGIEKKAMIDFLVHIADCYEFPLLRSAVTGKFRFIRNVVLNGSSSTVQ